MSSTTKATTIKEALQRWEQQHQMKAYDGKEIKIYGQIPPLEKMDPLLSNLVKCEVLSLSTNCIEKIANLNGLKNLRILSLGRNNIKSLNGLEPVGETLEELWISYNLIERLRGVHVLKNLKVLYISNNLIKEWVEFQRLADLQKLEELVFVGNPLEERNQDTWRDEVVRRLPRLKKLDGVTVIREDDEDEEDDKDEVTVSEEQPSVVVVDEEEVKE